LEEEIFWLLDTKLEEIEDDEYEEVVNFLLDHLEKAINKKFAEIENIEKQKYLKRKELFPEEFKPKINKIELASL
jgi:hypothetical protein